MKKLAVLMPTYNCAAYLKESIDSILNQTFCDFDFYIYDDCSTDNSSEIIKSYSDNRIFYRKNDSNLGISKTLNKGLEELLSKYEFIARMDADDWAFPERLQQQIDFLDDNQSLVFCGTQGFWLNDMNKMPNSGWSYPLNYNFIKLYLLFSASFGHSSILFRSKSLKINDLKYNEEIRTCEDWNLWVEISKIGIVQNMPDFLMKYRILPNSNHRSAENIKLHLKERSIIISDYWKTFDINLSPEQVFEYYYETENSIKVDFAEKLKTLINCFNKLYLNHANNLESDDREKFSYLLARKMAGFWKRSNVSKINPTIWFLMLSKVKFISFIRLIKSQLN